MANLRSTSPLNAHYSGENLSDDVNSLNIWSSVASLTLSDLLLPVFNDYRGGSFGCRMVNLGGSSRYSVEAHMNGDEDFYEDDDLNDELVPWRHSKKLPRDRLKKPGKKASAYLRTNKNSSYTQFKPGCIHGKNGFGIHFRC